MANHEHVLKVNVYEALRHVLHMQLLNESPHHPSYILLPPILRTRKGRLRELKYLAPGYTLISLGANLQTQAF